MVGSVMWIKLHLVAGPDFGVVNATCLNDKIKKSFIPVLLNY